MTGVDRLVASSKIEATAHDRPRSRKIREILAVSLVLVAAAGLRLYRIDAHDFRLDESFVQWIGQQSLADQVDIIARTDAHPPLHYLVQSAWRPLGGTEAIVRSLSVLFSLVTLTAGYLIARRATGSVAHALAVAALVGLSPWQVTYAQDARMYALASALLGIVLLCACAEISGGRSPVARAGYTIAATLSLYTHSSLAVSVATVGIVTFGLLYGRGDRHGARTWFRLNVAVVAVWALWWPTLIRQVNRLDESLAWVPEVDGGSPRPPCTVGVVR